MFAAPDGTIELRFSRPFVAVILVLGVPAMLGVSGFLLWVVSQALLSPRSGGAEGFVAVLFVTLIAIFMAWPPLVLLKVRHALFTSYLLNDEGIVARRPGGRDLALRWYEFDSATSHLLGKMVVLNSNVLEKPFVLLNNGSFPTRAWIAARDLALAKLGGKVEKKWI